jgi:hypothetical protein
VQKENAQRDVDVIGRGTNAAARAVAVKIALIRPISLAA